jgi:uncharacterized membrane protein YccC
MIFKWLYILCLLIFIVPATGYMRYLLRKRDRRGAFGVGIFIAFSILVVWAK